MKKFSVIFLMSYLLSFMPMIFGAHKDSQPGAISIVGNEYCYRKQGAILFRPLKDKVKFDDDLFHSALDHIKEASKNIKKEEDSDITSLLPIFTFDIRNKPNTVQIINPEGGQAGDYFSPVLYTIISKFKSDKKTFNLFNENAEHIAIINILRNPYNPTQPVTEPALDGLKKIVAENPSEKTSIKPSNWRTPFAIGAILGICALYAVSKFEYWNKDLAPSIEAFFTRLSNSCQNMFSRISSHTNNLRA